MNKTFQWIIWVLALIAVNIPILTLASFSLFSSAEGASILSIDYLIAASIIIVGNIITTQLFFTIYKNHYTAFIYGLLTAVAQSVGLYLFTVTFAIPWLYLTGLSVLLALVLLILQIKQPKA